MSLWSLFIEFLLVLISSVNILDEIFLLYIFFTCFLFCIMSFLSTRVSADMFDNESLSKHYIFFYSTCAY